MQSGFHICQHLINCVCVCVCVHVRTRVQMEVCHDNVDHFKEIKLILCINLQMWNLFIITHPLKMAYSKQQKQPDCPALKNSKIVPVAGKIIATEFLDAKKFDYQLS